MLLNPGQRFESGVLILTQAENGNKLTNGKRKHEKASKRSC